jgi:NTE family protein
MDMFYSDLLAERVTVDLILRIDRKNDIHTVANKTFDFSSRTIRHLLNNGYKDTMDYIKTSTN